MINYIRSEFYRVFHTKGSYLFILVCDLLLISANVVLAVTAHNEPTFAYANTSFSISLVMGEWTVLFLICFLVASISFGNEYSSHTLKNSVSYGVTRGTIYFGKFIVEVLYALLAFLIIVGLDFASAYLLLENSGPEPLQLFFKSLLAALPLLIGSLAVSHCFLSILEGSVSAMTSIVLTAMVFPIVCGYLGIKYAFFSKLAGILPYNLIRKMSFDSEKFQLILPWEGSKGYLNYWFFGLAWALLFIVIGFAIFRKKEIK